MSETWNISYYRASFSAPVKLYFNSKTQMLVGPPPPGAAEFDRIMKLLEEAEAFVSEIRRLKTAGADPTPSFQPAYDETGTPIDKYFVLKIGGWRGFYFVDHDNKVAIGTLALHSTDDPMKSLREALKDAASKG